MQTCFQTNFGDCFVRRPDESRTFFISCLANSNKTFNRKRVYLFLIRILSLIEIVTVFVIIGIASTLYLLWYRVHTVVEINEKPLNLKMNFSGLQKSWIF